MSIELLTICSELKINFCNFQKPELSMYSCSLIHFKTCEFAWYIIAVQFIILLDLSGRNVLQLVLEFMIEDKIRIWLCLMRHLLTFTKFPD